MSKVITLIALGLVAYYWAVTQKLKARALSGARQRCKAAGVQLLDHTVVQNKVRFVKDRHRRWRIERTYCFDFTSTGEHRYHGKIILMGGFIVDTQLDAFSIN